MTTVVLTTSKGSIEIELNAKKASNTVKNFLEYVNSGFYDATIFHRVIEGFMIQGGGFTESMTQKDTYAKIKNEANNGLLNNRGSIAMARTTEPHSASSQFFINLADNDFLNFTSETTQGWGYAVFGQVIKGMEVVDAISHVATGRMMGMADVPNEPVMITKVRIVS
ncbi:MAG: peptidylprolyl isomerase [Ostreibacterium sp.]